MTNDNNMPAQLCRCRWCEGGNSLYLAYHDHEWGVPQHDDRRLFEMLVLESFQAGLSWACVLNKREAFRRAFDGFDYNAVATYDERRVEELMHNSGIIRNRLKIRAATSNARVFIDIRHEFGSFDAYLSSHTGGHVFRETGLVTSPLSDIISRDLRRRGMKFVGSVIIYSYLQAVGIIDSHEEQCYLYQGR